LKKIAGYVHIIIFTLAIIFLIVFNQIDKLLYHPLMTPEMWRTSQPYIEIEFFSHLITIMQPSSTFFVGLLGIITIILGIKLLRIRRDMQFITRWAISLLLWGIGAILAGTSYQIFSYEIKCAGRLFCLWTSMFEIVYLMLSVGSVNTMLMAQANLEEKDKPSRIMRRYAIANYYVFLIITIIGSIIPIQFLISFELMILMQAPTILFLLILNIRRYLQFDNRINFSLTIIWVSLILIIGVYFLYFMLDITNILWEQGIWFSENDILHIALILWMLYIYIAISKFRKILK
jgi:hypothetical protein